MVIESLALNFPNQSQQKVQPKVKDSEVYKFLAYNKALDALDTQIDTRSDLFRFWSEMEHLLEKIR